MSLSCKGRWDFFLSRESAVRQALSLIPESAPFFSRSYHVIVCYVIARIWLGPYSLIAYLSTAPRPQSYLVTHSSKQLSPMA
jgi:hypothetical protein